MLRRIGVDSRPGLTPGRGGGLAFDQTNVAGARTLAGIFRREFDALSFAKQFEHRAATELRWKKCSMPPSSRMKPNPLSMRSLAIVPVGIPEALRSDPSRTSQGAFSRQRAPRKLAASRCVAGCDSQPLVELENRASLGVLSDGSQAKVGVASGRRNERGFAASAAWPFRGSAADRWSRSAARISGRPRTDRVSTACPGPGSRMSIWVPQRMQRIWIPTSLMPRILADRARRSGLSPATTVPIRNAGPQATSRGRWRYLQ